VDRVGLVLSVVLIVVCWVTAVVDVRREPRIVEIMDRLEVPERFRTPLGLFKFLAGLGLVIGLWSDWVLAVTSACLVVYFALATCAHLRVRDSVSDTVPAAVLCMVSMIVLAAS
jgi:hypothetical protein